MWLASQPGEQQLHRDPFLRIQAGGDELGQLTTAEQGCVFDNCLLVLQNLISMQEKKNVLANGKYLCNFLHMPQSMGLRTCGSHLLFHELWSTDLGTRSLPCSSTPYQTNKKHEISSNSSIIHYIRSKQLDINKFPNSLNASFVNGKQISVSV